MIIKTFESFSNVDDSNIDIQELISNINLIYNYSVVRSDEVNQISNFVHRNLNGNKVIDLISAPHLDNTDMSIPHFDLEDWEERQIVDTYTKLYKMYHLEKLPVISDMYNIFVPITHSTDVDMTIYLSQFVGVPKLIFDIDTIPKIKNFPNPDEFYIDIDSYDEIVSEIKPAVDRIKSMGYKVEVKLAKFGEIKLIVSK